MANAARSGFDGTPKPMGSYPDSGISVLIVGAGLAGLTAAIECTRKGHKVRVLERHEEISTLGMSPSCCQNEYRHGNKH
jgi:succinate dehydrogenase/fumarate reductase flavoprotein subunit